MRFSAQHVFERVLIMKNAYKHISMTLKELRRQNGWSLDKAAEQTGVSKAMLGQIERGESSPTIATLWKIASGFNTSFSSFIEDIHSELQKPVQRSRKAQRLHPADKTIRVKSLFPFDKQLSFEIFVIELLPTCEHLSPPHQPGVIEHVVVAQGKMEILINGKWQILTKGEGIRFDANQSHGYRNLSHETAIIHDMIHYPKSV